METSKTPEIVNLDQPANNEKNPEIRVVNLSRSIEESSDPDLIMGRLPELFQLLERDFGMTLLKGPKEIGGIYKIFQSENCLVRVEKFTKILEILKLNKRFVVGESSNDSHYANAVISEPDGISLAFAEGEASGSLKIAIGLGKSLVGFKANTKNLKISQVDFPESDIRDVEKRTFLCRHIEGKITKDDIRGVVIRIPYRVFPEKLLTESERNDQGPFIFRGFIL